MPRPSRAIQATPTGWWPWSRGLADLPPGSEMPADVLPAWVGGCTPKQVPPADSSSDSGLPLRIGIQTMCRASVSSANAP